MMTLLIAAAAAAAQPTTTAAANAQAQNEQHMETGKAGEHKDCCKECCKDMAATHEGHGSEHAGHSGQ